MMIHKTGPGDEIHRYQKSIVVVFPGKRRVLSTSPVNGGYREDLKAAFNKDCSLEEGIPVGLELPSYEEYIENTAKGLGLNPGNTAGICTTASMDNASIKEERYRELVVTAVVTAGIEVNGGRVGDPATFDESNDREEDAVPRGTINTILIINVDLTPGALARALVTCTEAKSAALQELMAPSRYSTGLATGSGTDGSILICNAGSPALLRYAGKHTKLGELIGKSVIGAVKEALYNQTGLDPAGQRSVLKRFSRYGLTEESLWRRYCLLARDHRMEKPGFMHNLHALEREARLVTFTSLYIHLLDQYGWELLGREEVKDAAVYILGQVNRLLGLKGPVGVKVTGDGCLIQGLTGLFEESVARAAGKLVEPGQVET